MDGSIDALIRDLADQDVRLWVEAGSLKFSAPAEGLNPALKDQLRQRRSEIVSLLSGAALESAEAAPQALTVSRLDRIRPLPASAEQRRLWHVANLEPNGAYSLPLAVRIGGALDPQRMAAALLAVATRHEAFRTRFALDEAGALVQHIEAVPRFTVAVKDLGQSPVPGLPHGSGDPETLARLIAEPLRCDEGPIGRGFILRLPDGDHIVLIVLHHIVTDGWSWGIIMRDLIRAYEEGPEALAPTELDFADFAAARNGVPTSKAAHAFWAGQLAGAPSLSSFPGDLPRMAMRAARPGSLTRTFPAELSAAFEDVLRAEGLSAYAALSALHALGVAVLADQGDVVLGAAVANRAGPPEIEDCVGFFSNTVANRIGVDQALTFREFLRRVAGSLKEGLSHQAFPFEDAVQLSGVARDAAWTPLVQILLAVQTLPTPGLDVPGLTFNPVEIDPPASRFDWETQAYTVDGLWQLYCEYDAGLYSPGRADAIIDALLATLARGLEAPDRHLMDIAAPLEALRANDQPLRLGEAVINRYVPNRRCHAMRRGDAAGRPILSLFLEGPPPSETVRKEIAEALRVLANAAAEIVPVAHWPLTSAGDTDCGRLFALPTMPASHVAAIEGERPGRRLAPIPVTVPPRPDIDLRALDPAILGRTQQPRTTKALITLPPSGEAYLAGDPADLPADWPASVPPALAATARTYPDHGVTVIGKTGAPTRLTFAALFETGLRIAAGLMAEGVKPGAHVILTIPTLADFFPALWGCLLAGAVPVTIAPARKADASDATFMKLVDGWVLFHRPVIVCDAISEPMVEEGSALFPGGAPQITTVGCLSRTDPLPEPAARAADDIAFVQLTSGSTGAAKGVQIRHRGIAYHVWAMQRFNGYAADWVGLNWLPYDHVGALLTSHLTDSWLGANQVAVETEMVLRDPGLWLDLMERHRVTRSWSPNFGYKLLINHAARVPEKRWDLSSLRFLMNGGEQVTPSVLRDFERLLLRNGAYEAVMQPTFGMAEACSTITFENAFSTATGIESYDKGVLETGTPSNEAIELVSLGGVVPGVEIKVVDAAGATLPERRIGRYLIRGEVVTPGYFDNPAATAGCLIGDGWMDSGDLAFIDRGRLFMTGRSKEMLILNGVNYYCHELEDIFGDIIGVLPTYVAAIGVREGDDASEALAIFFASDLEDTAALSDLIAVVRRRVVKRFSLTPAYCLPLTRAAFPKGTSGKIQRMQLKTDLEAGRFADLISRFGQARQATMESAWLATPVWRRDAGEATRHSVEVQTHALDPTDPDGSLAATADMLMRAQGKVPRTMLFGVGDSAPRSRALAQAVAALAECAMVRSPALDVRAVLVDAARDPHAVEAELAREAALKPTRAGALVRIDAEGRRWTRPLSPAEPGLESLPWDRSRPVLVLGGLGDIGCALAADVLRRGDGPVLIAGRTRTGRRAASWDKLVALGGDRVSFLPIDADSPLPTGAPDLWTEGGLVINAIGGGVDAAPLSAASLGAAMADKRNPAEQVEAAFADRPGVTIVHVGSVTGHFGGSGVEAYSAAHGWLDALATGPQRRVVAFSQWRDTGASRGHAPLNPQAAHGLRSMTVDQAVRLFWLGLSTGHPLVAVGIDLTAAQVLRRSTVAPLRGEDWQMSDDGENQPSAVDAAGRPLALVPAGGQSSARTAGPVSLPSEYERTLFPMWAKVLGTEAFGIADNFFAVGGSSLQLVKVHRAIQEWLKRPLPLVTLYKHPTIASLAAHLAATDRDGEPVASDPVTSDPVASDAAASSAVASSAVTSDAVAVGADRAARRHSRRQRAL